MPDFYSPMLTENADGTQTSHHSLGNSNKMGTTIKQHIVRMPFPAGRTFAVGDKIVFLSVPTDWKPTQTEFTTTRGVGLPAGVMKMGVFESNEDGSVGDKVSANSDDLFGTTINLTSYHTTFGFFMFAGPLVTFRDHGLQMWELINVADAGTYTENPGGMFAIAGEVTTTFTTVVDDEMQLTFNYLSTGN